MSSPDTGRGLPTPGATPPPVITLPSITVDLDICDAPPGAVAMVTSLLDTVASLSAALGIACGGPAA